MISGIVIRFPKTNMVHIPTSRFHLASRMLGITAVFVAVIFGSVPLASAASSWSPTLLVNTESFQAIDAGDNTTDVELRFGASTKTIKFLISKPVFQFSHSISVLGTLSGSSLNVDRNGTVGGTFAVSGAITGMNAITAKTTLSGNTLVISNSAKVGGALSASGSVTLEGSLSGATIAGFGLYSCNGATQKIVYNNSTGKFECATDQNTTAWSNTGSLQNGFDKRFVNTHGDTMTGNLIIRSSSGVTAVNLNVIGGISGAFLRTSGAADIHGPLAVSGAIRTDGNLTINDDLGAVDAVLTFGNNSTTHTITFLHSKQVFQFSKSISVLGTLSGSSLNVDRNGTVGGTFTVSGAITGMNAITAKTTLSGNTLVVSNSAKVGGTLSASGTVSLEGHLTGATIAGFGLRSCNGGGQTLQWNSSTNKFECGSAAVGNSSGGLISLHPEYPNAILFGSGADVRSVGQMTASGTFLGANKENFYHWTSSKPATSTLNQYWISVRVRMPNNFASWDPLKPIELRYRTGSGQLTGTSTGSYVSVRMLDTAGNRVTLTGGENLANTNFTTANIRGPESSGTFTPSTNTTSQYFTVFVKLAASTTANGNWFAQAGYLNLNYETTTP